MNKTYIKQSVVPGLYDIDLGFGQIFGVNIKTLELLKNDIENEVLNLEFAEKEQYEA